MSYPRTDGPRRASGSADMMARVQAGSAAAFGELYDSYCDRAYSLAVRICRDRGRAEDAAQSAFLAIWHSRASYREDRGSVGAWVMTIVHHRAIDIVRADHATRIAAADALACVPAAGDTAVQGEANIEADHIRGLLANLPHPQHEVIALAFYGGLSHTEIAAHLGIPNGTVKSRMRLGLQKLRVQLEATAA